MKAQEIIAEYPQVRGLLDILDKIIPEESIEIDWSDRRIKVLAWGTDHGRRLAGKFVMAGYELKAVKPWKNAHYLQAEFSTEGGWKFVVDEYKPRTCKIVKKKRWVEAQEARPAVPAHEEEYTELVCDGETKES